MVIFHSYVSLPEGIVILVFLAFFVPTMPTNCLLDWGWLWLLWSMMGIPMNQPVHWLYKCNKHSFVGPSVPHFITVCHDGHDGHDRNVFHPSKGEQKATQELLNCRGKSNLRKIWTGFSGVYECSLRNLQDVFLFQDSWIPILPFFQSNLLWSAGGRDRLCSLGCRAPWCHGINEPIGAIVLDLSMGLFFWGISWEDYGIFILRLIIFIIKLPINLRCSFGENKPFI